MYKHIVNNYIQRACPPYAYLYVHNVFSDEELGKICEQFSKKEKDFGKIGRNEENEKDSNLKIRNSDISWATHDEKDFFWIFERLNYSIDNLNNYHYNYDINGYDVIQYGEYPAERNGHYTWHMDLALDQKEIPPAGMIRKLSAVILLNEPGVDFEGGEFEINTSHEDECLNTNETLKKGSMLLFPSWVLHRVKPVTKGIRKSLVVWVVGPAFR